MGTHSRLLRQPNPFMVEPRFDDLMIHAKSWGNLLGDKLACPLNLTPPRLRTRQVLAGLVVLAKQNLTGDKKTARKLVRLILGAPILRRTGNPSLELFHALEMPFLDLLAVQYEMTQLVCE